jgi:hypothetical protein
MNERHSLIAFCAILVAICYLATIAAYLAYHAKYAEALGFGGLTTGLVGVIGTFRPKATGASETQDATLKAAVDKIPPETVEAAQ